MSDARLTSLDAGEFAAAEGVFAMDDASFAAFYEATARPLWRYLARVSGAPRLADDLLHEAYYRVLRSGVTFESDEHRRHYLFRVAANLVHDHRRRAPLATTVLAPPDDDTLVDESTTRGDRVAARIDLEKALAQLTPRERSLLWCAYVDGQSHEEIAAAHQLKRGSLKTLLARARRRVIDLLGASPARSRQ